MLAGQRGRGASNRTPQMPAPVSPLVASYDQFAFGRPTTVLPRPPAQFQIGAFGPEPPLIPMPVDQADEDGALEPRRVQYPVAWNLPVGVPGSEGLGKLASFNTLRAMADKYSVFRAAMQRRIQEMIGLDWDIVPTKDAEEAMKGSATYRTDWQKRHVQMMKFWERPDRSADSPYFTYEEWATALWEDCLVTDAVALYLHPPLGGPSKGWFGSSVGSLDLIDGTTVRPLYSMSGGLPAPSAVAYQQFLWGVPRSDFATIAEGRDVDELPDYVDTFAHSEMAYLRYWPRTWSPYGFSTVEQALMPIAIGYARQTQQLEFYCYDDQTELLTSEGWKKMPDVRGDELVATRSPSGAFEWQHTKEGFVHSFDYDGHLVEFANKRVNLRVTPNHRMLTRWCGRNDGGWNRDWHIQRADFFLGRDSATWQLPVTSTWVGDDVAEMVIPDDPRRVANHRFGRGLTVPMEDFCRFLGVFLAEGWVRPDRNDIIVSQSPDSPDLEGIALALKRVGLRWNYDAKNMKFTASHARLAAWLRGCGQGAANKHLPEWMLNLAGPYLEAFLDGYTMGDGHTTVDGQRRWYTTSRLLADQVVEIVQKCGRSAWVQKRPPNGVGRLDHYYVAERREEAHLVPRPKLVPYHGKVYCPSVPNGIVYVRREGQAVWCGNTEGTVPYTYVIPGNELVQSPQQIRQLQNALNSISGDTGWKQKVVVLPPGSKTEMMKPFDQASSFDYLISTFAIMPLGLNPSDLGMIPSMGGGTSGFSYESARMVQSGQANSQDRWLEPFVAFWGRQFNRVIQSVFRQTDMEWHWTGLEQGENADELIQQQVNLLRSSVITIDEARSEMGLDTFGADWSQIPLSFSNAGVSLITDAVDASAAQAEIAAEGGGHPKPNSTAGMGSPVQTHTLGQRGQPTTPAHDAARTVEHQQPSRPHNHAGGHPIKAVTAELEVLGRMLRKGRSLDSFETHVLSPAVLDAVRAALPDVDEAVAAGIVCAATEIEKAKKPKAAGLVVKASDTGRVLMIQRNEDNHNEQAAGRWEWPGGRLEDHEEPFEAARREWEEEVGCDLPDGHVAGQWRSGRYVGFVYVIGSEDDLDLGSRDERNPDSDDFEPVAWWTPADIAGNSAVRVEVQSSDWALIGSARKGVLPKADARVLPWHLVHDVDLRIADHYEPLIREALGQQVAGLHEAIVQAVNAARIVPTGKVTNGPGQLVRRIVDEVLTSVARLIPARLVTLVKSIWADSWLAATHSAASHQHLPVPAYLASLEKATDWSTWTPGDPAAALAVAGGGLAQLLQQAEIVIAGVDDTTVERIGDAVAAGIRLGEPTRDIAARVEDVLAAPWRAKMIARTETSRAMAHADFETFRNAGVLEWEWLDAPGACPICVNNAANGPYPMGAGPPLPQHPNCRCVPEAVIEKG